MHREIDQMKSKLKRWNQFFYGIADKRTGRRSGGLYYIAETALGGHTYQSRIAFGLIESSAKDGNKTDNRPAEREFMLRSGRELCNFLKLDFNIVYIGIERIWETN